MKKGQEDMKNMKKILALVVAMMLVVGMVSALAAPADNGHTITITSHGTGAHTYEVYQVFDGNLDAAEGVLSDITWGDGVDGTSLLTELKDTTKIPAALKAGDASLFAACEDAKAVAKVIEAHNNAAFLQAFADVVSTKLVAANKLTGNTNPAGTTNSVSITVPAAKGDGYYFIQDVTAQASLQEGDTLSKFILQVVRDVDITAKDTVLTPDKEIVEGTARVKEGSSAIGDTVTFQVAIPVPDTTVYQDHFVFQMFDTLPAGLTFTGLSKIEIGDYNAETKTMEATPDLTLSNTQYTVYTSQDGTTYSAPTEFANVQEAITSAGGQHVKVVFNNFKNVVETNSLVNASKTVCITYTAVVNDDAQFGSTGNINEVEFKYSNDPTHVYHGDEFGEGEPQGTTPESRTITFVTTLKVLKKDGGNNNPLAGAKFTLTATDVLNYVLQTGEEYILKSTFDANEEAYTRIGTDVWYELKDGTYTTTVAGSTINGRVINDTQYVNKDVQWVKVSYSRVVTEAVAGTPETLTAISGEDGIIYFEGLKPGTYTLTEIIAPDGYNLLTESKEVTITWDRAGYEAAVAAGASGSEEQKALAAAGGFKISASDIAAGWSMTANGALYEITILNYKGAELPSTGGIGTTIFYVGGGLLVLLAVILLVTKRRMNAND